jgi:hypothetical protein
MIMGKKKEKHRQKVQARNAILNNPVARGAVALASRGKVIDKLNRASTDDQIHVLDSQVASTSPDKLKQAIMSHAGKEMDKAVVKFRKEGKPVTVDSLTAEIRSTPSFLKMCDRVGVTLEWFENLARERMGKFGITESR